MVLRNISNISEVSDDLLQITLLDGCNCDESMEYFNFLTCLKKIEGSLNTPMKDIYNLMKEK